MGRIIALLVVVLLFMLLFFPRWIPRLLGLLGRSVRDAGQVGAELATGEEHSGSPLARYEVQAGDLVLLKIQASVVPTDDAKLQEMVEALGRRVASQARRKEIPYRFTVVEEPEPNAFAVPGGAIFVSRSLLYCCHENRDRIASLLGHEIAHIDLRHAVYNLATRAAVKTGTQLVSLGRAGVLKWFSGSIQDLLVKGYRQDQEFEADRVGASLAQAAGFDPRGLSDLLREVAAKRDSRGDPFDQIYSYFSTHPPLAERIARLQTDIGQPRAS